MPEAGLALLARRAAIGVAIEAASPDSADGREKGGKGAYGGRLAGSAVAEGKHAADGRVYGGDD
jgi:hypothetical protein